MYKILCRINDDSNAICLGKVENTVDAMELIDLYLDKLYFNDIDWNIFTVDFKKVEE